MANTGFRAVLFDLDGTLLHRTAGFNPYLADLHSRLKFQHVPLGDYQKRFHELDGQGHGDKINWFRILVSEFSLPVSAEQLVSDYRDHFWKFCTPAPGA